MANPIDNQPASVAATLTFENKTLELPKKSSQSDELVGSVALPALEQAAAAPSSGLPQAHEQRFMRPLPPAKRHRPTNIRSLRTKEVSSSSSSAAAPQKEVSSSSSSAAAPQAVQAQEQKEAAPALEREKEIPLLKKEEKGRMGTALMYGKVAFAACVAPDALNLVESVIEQPSISSACVASVNALSTANLATRIGGIVFLTPGICRRVVWGTPWEQAATLAAGLAACYCSGGALVPTLLFAEGAGLIAEGAEGTRAAVARTAKKAKNAYDQCVSTLSNWHRPSVRQTFHNLSARLWNRRAEERAADRTQRLDEARHGDKKSNGTQDDVQKRPDDSQTPQP